MYVAVGFLAVPSRPPLLSSRFRHPGLWLALHCCPLQCSAVSTQQQQHRDGVRQTPALPHDSVTSTNVHNARSVCTRDSLQLDGLQVRDLLQISMRWRVSGHPTSKHENYKALKDQISTTIVGDGNAKLSQIGLLDKNKYKTWNTTLSEQT